MDSRIYHSRNHHELEESDIKRNDKRKEKVIKICIYIIYNGKE